MFNYVYYIQEFIFSLLWGFHVATASLRAIRTRARARGECSTLQWLVNLHSGDLLLCWGMNELRAGVTKAQNWEKWKLKCTILGNCSYLMKELTAVFRQSFKINVKGSTAGVNIFQKVLISSLPSLPNRLISSPFHAHIFILPQFKFWLNFFPTQKAENLQEYIPLGYCTPYLKLIKMLFG